MKTVADLKRAIKRGIKIKLIEATMNGAKQPHKALGLVRTVTKVQTNGFYCATDEQLAEGKKGSFCDMPKAMEFIGYGNTFSISDSFGFRKYEVLEAATV